MPSRGSEDASGALPEPMQPGSPYSDWRIGLERITLFSDGTLRQSSRAQVCQMHDQEAGLESR